MPYYYFAIAQGFLKNEAFAGLPQELIDGQPLVVENAAPKDHRGAHLVEVNTLDISPAERRNLERSLKQRGAVVTVREVSRWMWYNNWG